jgi:hypothetical protein
MAYTMAIRMKAASAKDLGFKSKGIAAGCILKIAAARAIG